MIRLSLLCLCTALFVTACKKDSTKPAPAFEGRWNIESETTVAYNAPGGNVTGRSTRPVNYYYAVVTKDSVLYRDTRTNASLGGVGYIRQGNNLKLDGADCTIKELSETHLILLFPDSPNAIPYTEIENDYYR